MALKRIGTVDEAQMQARSTGRLKKVGEVGKPTGRTAADWAAKAEEIRAQEKEKSVLGIGKKALTAYGKVVSTPFKALAAGAELGAQAGTAMLAEPISGIAGLAKTITSGADEGAKTIEQIQEAMTYQPRTQLAQKAIGLAGKTIGAVAEAPGIKQTGQAWESAKEAVNVAAGPLAATALSITPAALLEVLGMHGSRALRKSSLQKLVRGKNTSQLYDEFGNLIPEVEKAVKKSGLSAAEIDEILPQQTLTHQAIQEPAAKVAEAATARISQRTKMADIAEEVRPSKEILDAAEEFGLAEDIPASWASTNPTYQAIEQGLKSVPSSALKERELNAYRKMAQKADDLVKEFGGTTSKSQLSGQFRADSLQAINDLEAQADIMYKKVRDQIDVTMPVTADKTLADLQEMASRKVVGGDIEAGKKRLDKFSRNLLDDLSQGDLTYDYLDALRQDVGQALHKKTGPLKDKSRGLLKRLYKNLTKDQEASIKNPEALATFKTAKATVAQRKALEMQLSKVIGKELTGDIAQTAKQAVLALQDGRTKEFDNLINNIPKELGPQAKQKIIATALKDVFVQGSKKEKQLHAPGFDNFMNGLKENPENMRRMAKHLGTDNMKRLNTYHNLVSGARKAMAHEITTGKSLAVPKIMDEIENVATKVYGASKATGQMGQNIVGALLGVGKTPRSISADKLLADRKFRRLMKDYATGKLNTAEKVAQAEKILEDSKKYQSWRQKLPKADLEDIRAFGPISYLLGMEEDEDNI